MHTILKKVNDILKKKNWYLKSFDKADFALSCYAILFLLFTFLVSTMFFVINKQNNFLKNKLTVLEKNQSQLIITIKEQDAQINNLIAFCNTLQFKNGILTITAVGLFTVLIFKYYPKIFYKIFMIIKKTSTNNSNCTPTTQSFAFISNEDKVLSNIDSVNNENCFNLYLLFSNNIDTKFVLLSENIMCSLYNLSDKILLVFAIFVFLVLVAKQIYKYFNLKQKIIK